LSDKQIESKELEWYLRDHFFRQSNKGVTQFERKLLTQDMITLYLRHRNYSRQRIEEMINPVLENLISRRVITGKDNNNKNNNSGNFDLNSFELAYPLSRLQCSACFYISYLSTSEPRSCLRCSSINLHDFPLAKQKKTHRE
jgi:hypothetical protein